MNRGHARTAPGHRPRHGFDLFPIEVADGDVSGLDADGIAVFRGSPRNGAGRWATRSP